MNENQTQYGIPTRDEIKELLNKGELIVSPILETDLQIGEGSIDLRLGTKIIYGKRTEFPLIDPRSFDSETARRFQSETQLAIGWPFVIHPRQFILASTFEFIRLPPNMAGFVLSRSRYGRIGLLVATATYIQPGWKGVLTLELLNEGEVPIKLTTGTRIAQLVPISAFPSYLYKQANIPDAVEFADLVEDPKEWEKLSMFRNEWMRQGVHKPIEDQSSQTPASDPDTQSA